MPTPTLNDEVAFISGVYPDGTLPLTCFSAWRKGTNPADYSGGYTNSAKFGTTTAATAGGTVTYYFDPTSAWTATEQQVFVGALALWSAVANIGFALTTDAAQANIKFVRGTDGKAVTTGTYTVGTGAGVTGGTVLLGLNTVTVSIDTSAQGYGPIKGSFSNFGGYPYLTVLHEVGHALGLGHAGAYNSTIDVATQQFSAYDTTQWSVMSYIFPDESDARYYNDNPAKGTSWGWSPTQSDGYQYGLVPTTWMPLDILALQALYGAPTSSPLSGGQVFGFHCTIAGSIGRYFDFDINSDPVVTLFSTGTGNTLDLSGFIYTTTNTVNLNPGTFSSCDGRTNNIAIAFGTAIDTYSGGAGKDVVTCNSNGDRVVLGSGNNSLYGGSGNDIVFDSGTGGWFDGGGGNDSLTLDRSATTIGLNFWFRPEPGNQNNVTGALIQNFEHLFITTGSFDDDGEFINPSYDVTWGANAWDGGAGNDHATIYVTSDTAGVTFQNTGSQYTLHQTIGGVAVDTLVLKNVESFRVLTGSGNDTLYGGNGSDDFDAGAGVNAIYAGGGNDRITDIGTASTIDGGSGTDFLSLDRSTLTASVNAQFTSGSSTPTVLSDGTSFANIENLYLATGSGDDTMSFGGLTAASWITWNAGSGVNRAVVDFSGESTALTLNGTMFVKDATAFVNFGRVQSMDVTLGSGDDQVTSMEPSGGLTVDGGPGRDTLAYGGRTEYIAATFTPGSSTWVSLPNNVAFRNIERWTLVTYGRGAEITYVQAAGVWQNSLYWDGNFASNNVLNIDMSVDTAGFSAGKATKGSHIGQYVVEVPVSTTLDSNGFSDVVVAALVNSVHVIGGSGNDTLTGTSGADALAGGGGSDVLSSGDEHDTLTGGAGSDALDGGSNIDTAVFSGNAAAYTITQGATGVFTVSGSDGTDTLSNIEYAKFDDKTVRLLPGTGTTIDWNAIPATYMAAIRDFDGNDLGSITGWKLIGTADVNGDGTAEHILVNRQNGRWAEIGTETDGQSYFANNGWAGDTRVVGIYIDPLVTSGEVVAGSDFDSQRRFQNDLNIENIHGILGQGDYNHDGLEEIYFSLTDGTAYLHAYMHADGNIQYANYQNEQQVKDYLTSNGFTSSTWAGWFPAAPSMLAAVAG